MKNVIYSTTFFALIFCLLLSCKKSANEQIVAKPVIPGIDSLALKDSVRFTLNENTYTITNGSSGSMEFGNNVADRKIDSIVHSGYYYSGSKDSTQFYSKYDITRDQISRNDSIYGLSVIFIKKFGNGQLVKGPGIQMPANKSALYLLGNYPYATDFQRENNQDGAGIELLTKAGVWYSYNPTMYGLTTTLGADIQKNSKFELVKYKKLSNGSYLIEARFSLNLFDKNEKSVRLDNGYLRIIRFLY